MPFHAFCLIACVRTRCVCAPVVVPVANSVFVSHAIRLVAVSPDVTRMPLRGAAQIPNHGASATFDRSVRRPSGCRLPRTRVRDAWTGFSKALSSSPVVSKWASLSPRGAHGAVRPRAGTRRLWSVVSRSPSPGCRLRCFRAGSRSSRPGAGRSANSKNVEVSSSLRASASEWSRVVAMTLLLRFECVAPDLLAVRIRILGCVQEGFDHHPRRRC